MKLNTNTHEVTGSGFQAVSEFGVEINAKTFKVLSDTIYKDKIGSIVRELSCNAYDSHTVAGKSDVPFEIHLPDNFEPYFSIRDFGTGISPEDIKTVYCQYFASTKDQSNDEVGAFGLGSKTPFSYTDAFTVISIHNGVKSMYNAHVSSGLPSIVAYGDPVLTDEPDGLEINVGIETLDYKAFAEAVKRQLKFFPVKPIIVNGSIDWSTIKPSLEIAGFTYYRINNPTSRYYGSRNEMAGLFLKQGPVGYPVDFDVINQYVNSKGLNKSSFFSYIENSSSRYDSGVIIEMPIGTVEVTASREGISYSDVTIRNLLTKFDAIAREVFKDVKKSLDASYAESNAKFVTTVKGLDTYFLSSLTKEKMEQNYPNFRITNAHGGGFHLELKMDKKFANTVIHRYDVGAFQKPKVVKKTEVSLDKGGVPYINLSMVQDNTIIYVKDIKTNFIGRIKDHCTESFCYLLELPSGVDSSDLEEAFGTGITVVNLSSLPAPLIKRVNSSGGGHSITGGLNRVWFNIGRLQYSDKCGFETGFKTLYSYNFEQEFAESIEDAVEEDQDYVYFLTRNNKVDPALNGVVDTTQSNEVMLFVEWLNKKGYKVVAIPTNSETKAIKTGQFISFKSLWDIREKDFYEDVWGMFGDWATNNYYTTVHHNFYNMSGYSARHMFTKVIKVMQDVGIDCTDIENKVNSIMITTSHRNKTRNHSIANIITQMKNHPDYDIRIDMMNKITEANSTCYNNNCKLTDYEDYMAKSGFNLEVCFSQVITEYVKMITDNIDKIIMGYISQGLGWDINNIVIRDPFPSETKYLSAERVLEVVKEKLDEGLTTPQV